MYNSWKVLTVISINAHIYVIWTVKVLEIVLNLESLSDNFILYLIINQTSLLPNLLFFKLHILSFFLRWLFHHFMSDCLVYLVCSKYSLFQLNICRFHYSYVILYIADTTSWLPCSIRLELCTTTFTNSKGQFILQYSTVKLWKLNTAQLWVMSRIGLGEQGMTLIAI